MTEPRVSKAPKLLTINIVLFAVAAVIASYMVWHHYSISSGDPGFGSFCSVSERVDCDVVNTSEYSELAGVPLATLALAYYLLALGLSLIARNPYSRRESILTLTALSSLGLVFSAWTLSVSALILKTVCLMCISLQTLNLATFVVTMLVFREVIVGEGLASTVRRAARKKILTYLGSGLAIFVVVFGLTSQLREDLFPLPDPGRYASEFRSRPQQEVAPGDSPKLGLQGDNPPVRIVEFADFQCPPCGMAAKQMHMLTRKYGNKFQLVFRNFPLDPSCNPLVQMSLHPHACLAAKAAYCAHKQGKFVELYEKLFTYQRQIDRGNVTVWAREAGLDMEAFENCVPSAETAAKIKSDIDEASRVGVQSTPTFFVNGRMVPGVIDEKRLKVLLRELGQ